MQSCIDISTKVGQPLWIEAELWGAEVCVCENKNTAVSKHPQFRFLELNKSQFIVQGADFGEQDGWEDQSVFSPVCCWLLNVKYHKGIMRG